MPALRLDLDAAGRELTDFAHAVAAVVLFASNILFWKNTDYFAPETGENPLLHTWSLAVEEQFYLIFPLALILIWRIGRGRVMGLVVAAGVASLILSDWASGVRPAANFYLLPTRAWELLAGAATALFLAGRPPKGHGGAAALGLALVLGPVFLYDETVPFPGRHALPTVLGTVLILLFAAEGTRIARLLAWRPAVAVGLVSYSAYLWHQPLLAFARIRTIGPLPPLLTAGLIGLTFLLAWASRRFVEGPFRHRAAPCGGAGPPCPAAGDAPAGFRRGGAGQRGDAGPCAGRPCRARLSRPHHRKPAAGALHGERRRKPAARPVPPAAKLALHPARATPAPISPALPGSRCWATATRSAWPMRWPRV